MKSLSKTHTLVSAMLICTYSSAYAQAVPDISALIAPSSAAVNALSSSLADLSSGGMLSMASLSDLAGLVNIAQLPSASVLNQPLGSALVNSVGALPLMSISSQLASGMESIAPYSSQAFSGLQTNATEPAGQLLNVILTDVAEGDALLGEYLPMSPMTAVARLLIEAQASLASVAEGLVVQQIPSIPTNPDELMVGLESAISFLPKQTAGVLLNTLETLPSSAAENGLLGDAGLLAGLQAEMTEIPQSLSEALSADGEMLAASLMNLSGQFSQLAPAELTGLLTDLQTNQFLPAELADALTSTQAAVEYGRAQLGF